MSWLRSSWPIDSIWRANQPEADPDAAVDLAAGSAALEIRRRGDTVALRGLDPAALAFRGALGRGLTLEIAADAALAEDPAFDLATAFRALLDEALLAGFTLPTGAPREEESR